MHIRKTAGAALSMTVIAAMILSAGCGGGSNSGAGGAVNLNSDNAKASYALGVNIGQNFKAQRIEIDAQTLARGIADVYAENDLLMTDMEMMEAINTLQASQQQMMEEESAANLQEASAFLASNAAKDGVTTLADSLQYEVITEGTGTTPKAGDVVRVHYTGTFMDGSQFDSSVERGQPIEFQVASGQIIPGWDEAIQLMTVGSKWRVFLPPQLAYGPAGRGTIPPNALLIFEMELLEIVEPTDG